MPVSDDLLSELLAKPVGPQMPKRTARPEDLTKELELQGNRLMVSISDEAGEVNETKARSFIREEGLDPDEWEISHWYKGKYGNHELVYDDDGQPVLDAYGVQVERYSMETVKYHFRRVNSEAFDVQVALEEALADLRDIVPVDVRPDGSHGFLVLIGDMQFGKIDGDGPAGTLRRTIECINKAAAWLDEYRKIFAIGHVHIAWLGDHVEGFVSQGGANVWRTTLTLNEQIRLTQAVMLHALKTFSPLAAKVTMVAVPGNHGEPVRFEGNGITRYDDSHDTESLIGIHSTIKTLEVPGFEHVEFYVPDTDELTVFTEVAGTRILHTHGHKFPNKKDGHLEWWRGQEFGRESLPAHLMVAGHLHNEFITENFIQVPAMESESTWYRHLKGVQSKAGLVVAITKNGDTPVKHTIYG